MIPASPESYDFQPRHYFFKKQQITVVILCKFQSSLLFCLGRSQTGLQSSRGIGRTSEGTDDYCKASRNSKPFLLLLNFPFFLQKKAYFRFCGRDPSKMTILAPSRKPVRIGLYREGRKGPKSTFFGWSVFGVFGFFGADEILSLFSIHCRL